MCASSVSRAPRTMLITGATGFIGSRLATLALARGYSVKTLTRSDWSTAPAVPVEQRHLGCLPEQIPTSALQDVDVIVHCAASVDSRERRAWGINVEGTRRLAELACQARVRTFIFLSSQAARPDAVSVYGRTKYSAEQKLLQQEGLQIIILRPGLVTGTGSRGLFSRLTRLVDSNLVIPMLGGGRSIVQPIHVDDLCEAIFRCDEASGELDKTILKLGHCQGVPLREFLQCIAVARLGHKKVTVPIPFWPVEVLVTVAEALRVPLPINSNNLKGLRVVEKMDTATDLARLGLNLRPLQETIHDGAQFVEQPLSLNQRAVRVLLIGAGRIGLVHAVTLSRLCGVVLAGVVDPNARARALLRGMGVSAPMFRSLEEALAEVKPDAAVIATPVSTHLALTRAALANGLAVMVEKPLAIQRDQLTEYQCLAQQFPERPVQVGYVMPRNPQVSSYLNRVRNGEFGRVQGFVGVTLVSLIQEPSIDRWEVKKDISGGGVLINSGGHVLSMIRGAFGDPEALEVESCSLYSAEVEDSLILSFTYPGFRGRQYCSWSIRGYPRQENTLTIWTDQGRLILTGSVGMFIRNNGETELTHQLDFDVGFNIAPDYAGAGFAVELKDLKEAVCSGRDAPMNLHEAVGLERLMFKAYEISHKVKAFTANFAINTPCSCPPPRLSEPADAEMQRGVSRILDLRDLPASQVNEFLEAVVNRADWDEYLVTPAQIKLLSSRWQRSQLVRVTVPDFLNQSRLLSNGHYGEVIKQMGFGGVTAAFRVATPLLASERSPNFWVAAMGLLAAGLYAVPPEFPGTILLHGYLTDFALSLGKLDLLEKMLSTCRKIRPQARVGFHSNMAAEASNTLRLLDVPVDEVSVLTSPNAAGMAATIESIRQVTTRGSVTAEVGLGPPVLHRIAFADPKRWACGADAVLIGIAADSLLAKQQRLEVEQEWAKVFPGLRLPEGVL
jgi:predicted dehydrogenase/nucleoside-diphosphate-sugar epimerase